MTSTFSFNRKVPSSRVVPVPITDAGLFPRPPGRALNVTFMFGGYLISGTERKLHSSSIVERINPLHRQELVVVPAGGSWGLKGRDMPNVCNVAGSPSGSWPLQFPLVFCWSGSGLSALFLPPSCFSLWTAVRAREILLLCRSLAVQKCNCPPKQRGERSSLLWARVCGAGVHALI